MQTSDSIFADVPLLRGVRRDLPCQQSPDVGEVGFAVVGVGDVLERQPHHLIVAVAHDAAQLLVDPQPATVQPDVGHADRRLLEGGPEPLLTFSTGLFSPFLFGGFPHRSPPRTKTPRCSRTALATDHPATAREVDYTHLRTPAAHACRQVRLAFAVAGGNETGTGERNGDAARNF